jgi:putative RNA 2'-phosphotransferase
MLGRCPDHGYYRAERCPVCKEKGKFLMSDEEIRKLGGTVTGILRHFPEQFGIRMDHHGWVNLGELVDAIKGERLNFHWLRMEHIVALAETDGKGRYEVDGDWVRATYAHTINLDLSDLPRSDADELYYPVTQEEADIIVETGLYPSDRAKVHLSRTKEKAMEAGQVRTDNPVILAIDAARAQEDGVDIRKAGRDVCVSDEIDAKYLSLVDEEQ